MKLKFLRKVYFHFVPHSYAKNRFNQLPSEVIQLIFNLLHAKDRASVRLSMKSFGQCHQLSLKNPAVLNEILLMNLREIHLPTLHLTLTKSFTEEFVFNFFPGLHTLKLTNEKISNIELIHTLKLLRSLTLKVNSSAIQTITPHLHSLNNLEKLSLTAKSSEELKAIQWTRLTRLRSFKIKKCITNSLLDSLNTIPSATSLSLKLKIDADAIKKLQTLKHKISYLKIVPDKAPLLSQEDYQSLLAYPLEVIHPYYFTYLLDHATNIKAICHMAINPMKVSYPHCKKVKWSSLSEEAIAILHLKFPALEHLILMRHVPLKNIPKLPFLKKISLHEFTGTTKELLDFIHRMGLKKIKVRPLNTIDPHLLVNHTELKLTRHFHHNHSQSFTFSR